VITVPMGIPSAPVLIGSFDFAFAEEVGSAGTLAPISGAEVEEAAGGCCAPADAGNIANARLIKMMKTD
jgi:hypothetical protein